MSYLVPRCLRYHTELEGHPKPKSKRQKLKLQTELKSSVNKHMKTYVDDTCFYI